MRQTTAAYWHARNPITGADAEVIKPHVVASVKWQHFKISFTKQITAPLARLVKSSTLIGRVIKPQLAVLKDRTHRMQFDLMQGTHQGADYPQDFASPAAAASLQSLLWQYVALHNARANLVQRRVKINRQLESIVAVYQRDLQFAEHAIYHYSEAGPSRNFGGLTLDYRRRYKLDFQVRGLASAIDQISSKMDTLKDQAATIGVWDEINPIYGAPMEAPISDLQREQIQNLYRGGLIWHAASYCVNAALLAAVAVGVCALVGLVILTWPVALAAVATGLTGVAIACVGYKTIAQTLKALFFDSIVVGVMTGIRVVALTHQRAGNVETSDPRIYFGNANKWTWPLASLLAVATTLVVGALSSIYQGIKLGLYVGFHPWNKASYQCVSRRPLAITAGLPVFAGFYLLAFSLRAVAEIISGFAGGLQALWLEGINSKVHAAKGRELRHSYWQITETENVRRPFAFIGYALAYPAKIIAASLRGIYEGIKKAIQITWSIRPLEVAEADRQRKHSYLMYPSFALFFIPTIFLSGLARVGFLIIKNFFRGVYDFGAGFFRGINALVAEGFDLHKYPATGTNLRTELMHDRRWLAVLGYGLAYPAKIIAAVIAGLMRGVAAAVIFTWPVKATPTRASKWSYLSTPIAFIPAIAISLVLRMVWDTLVGFCLGFSALWLEGINGKMHAKKGKELRDRFWQTEGEIKIRQPLSFLGYALAYPAKIIAASLRGIYEGIQKAIQITWQIRSEVAVSDEESRQHSRWMYPTWGLAFIPTFFLSGLTRIVFVVIKNFFRVLYDLAAGFFRGLKALGKEGFDFHNNPESGTMLRTELMENRRWLAILGYGLAYPAKIVCASMAGLMRGVATAVFLTWPVNLASMRVSKWSYPSTAIAFMPSIVISFVLRMVWDTLAGFCLGFNALWLEGINGKVHANKGKELRDRFWQTEGEIKVRQPLSFLGYAFAYPAKIVAASLRGIYEGIQKAIQITWQIKSEIAVSDEEPRQHSRWIYPAWGLAFIPTFFLSGLTRVVFVVIKNVFRVLYDLAAGFFRGTAALFLEGWDYRLYYSAAKRLRVEFLQAKRWGAIIGFCLAYPAKILGAVLSGTGRGIMDALRLMWSRPHPYGIVDVIDVEDSARQKHSYISWLPYPIAYVTSFIVTGLVRVFYEVGKRFVKGIYFGVHEGAQTGYTPCNREQWRNNWLCFSENPFGIISGLIPGVIAATLGLLARVCGDSFFGLLDGIIWGFKKVYAHQVGYQDCVKEHYQQGNIFSILAMLITYPMGAFMGAIARACHSVYNEPSQLLFAPAVVFYCLYRVVKFVVVDLLLSPLVQLNKLRKDIHNFGGIAYVPNIGRRLVAAIPVLGKLLTQLAKAYITKSDQQALIGNPSALNNAALWLAPSKYNSAVSANVLIKKGLFTDEQQGSVSAKHRAISDALIGCRRGTYTLSYSQDRNEYTLQQTGQNINRERELISRDEAATQLSYLLNVFRTGRIGFDGPLRAKHTQWRKEGGCFSWFERRLLSVDNDHVVTFILGNYQFSYDHARDKLEVNPAQQSSLAFT